MEKIPVKIGDRPRFITRKGTVPVQDSPSDKSGPGPNFLSPIFFKNLFMIQPFELKCVFILDEMDSMRSIVLKGEYNV
jgi:hypothetical protein